jgi:hypothetical protein
MSLGPENLSTAPRTEMPVLLKEVFMLVASAACNFTPATLGVVSVGSEPHVLELFTSYQRAWLL